MQKGHEREHSKTSHTIVPESIKDTKDISNVLSILDSQTIRTNPFGANVSGGNSYKRAERITAALHLITNNVPLTEPLRESVREVSLELLDILLELRAGFRTPASEKGQLALATIRRLVSFVRLLAVAGFISANNASVVVEALDELGDLIVASQRSTLSEQLTVSREDLMPVRESQDSQSTNSRTTRRASRRPSMHEDTRVPRGARTNQIMDILKLGGTLGIKDITANMPQYSEKMVQRELAELTRIGRIRKVGAKRWSRYQIVSAATHVTGQSAE